MRSLGSCLTVALISVLFFFAAFFQARQTSDLSVQPTATTVWATFPSSALTPYVTEAIYQPFEHGFMLWRADQNCVYAIRTDVSYSPHAAIIPVAIPTPSDDTNYAYAYCLSLAPLTDRTVQAVPPAGLSLPTGVLGKIWNYYDEIRAELGYATAPEQHYTATIPTNAGAAFMDGSPFTIAQMTLPDGTIFACGSRAATVGTC
jgi:hypothetical protein